MTSRPVLALATVAIVLASCGGGDSDGADTTLPEITLLTTTSEVELFEEGDGVIAPASTNEADADPLATTTVSPDAPTTIAADAVTTTTVAAADTTVATTPPPAETAPPAPAGDFVLGADGLGAIAFGADPEQTITFVSSTVGAPTSDTGWLDPIEIGPCSGTRIRQVSWNQLQLEFGDVSGVTQGRDHFYAYFYGAEGSSTAEPAGLKTAEQIGVGSRLADLIAAYPGVSLFQGDEFIGPSFNVNDNLVGRVSGLADDDVVEVIIGGLPCDG